MNIGNFSHKKIPALDLVGKDKTIYSPCNGKVRVATNNNSKKGYGTYLSLQDTENKNIRIILGHLKYNSLKVKAGDKIKIGQALAIEGSTGNSTGSHCHMEIRNSNGIGYKSMCAYTGLPNKVGKYNIKDYLQDVVSYTKGNYKTLYKMKVRTGAGINYANKKVKDLTKDGKKNATTKTLNATAIYKKGTVFTVQQIITNSDGSVWAKSPSGYICLADKNTKYCSKV